MYSAALCAMLTSQISASNLPADSSAAMATTAMQQESEIEIDDIRYLLHNDLTAEVTRFCKEWKENLTVSIPASVSDATGSTYRVTRIRKDAFATHCRFSSLTIGDNVEMIEEGAFAGTRVSTLVLGSKLAVVPDGCFDKSGVETLTIGESVTRIGRRAFADCLLSKVISRSSGFSTGEEAFANSTPDCGSWLKSIITLGDRAFFGATFISTPQFTQVTRIGKAALANTSISGTLPLPATLQRIAPDALSGSSVKFISVEEANPFYTTPNPYMLCNKACTQLVLLTNHNGFDFGEMSFPFPATLVRLGEGSIPSRAVISSVQGRNTYRSITIPASIVEMEGTFRDCLTLGGITCHAPLPPAVTDDTFNDEIFKASPDITLVVPVGSANAYRKAPGWRKFKHIKEANFDDVSLITPMPDAVMVLHDGSTPLANLCLPTGKISSMTVDDSQPTPRLLIKVDGKETAIDGHSFDSITWQRGVLCDAPMEAKLTKTSPAVDARGCTLTLPDLKEDESVRVQVSDVVLLPCGIEQCIKADAYSIEFPDLDDAQQKPFRMVIPVAADEKTAKVAARFDKAHGEWVPVSYHYDAEEGRMTVNGTGSSIFALFTLPRDKESEPMTTPAFAARLDSERLPRLFDYERMKGLALSDEWMNEASRIGKELSEKVTAIEAREKSGQEYPLQDYIADENACLQLQSAYSSMLNTRLRLHFTDASADDNHASAYKDCRIRISGPADSITMSNGWECTLDENGEGCIEIGVTDIIGHSVKGELILTGRDGIDRRSFSFCAPVERRYEKLHQCVSDLNIDIKSDGSVIDAPELIGLRLTYEQPTVTVPYMAGGSLPAYDIDYLERAMTSHIYLDNKNLRNARLQKGIERCLAAITSIQVDDKGQMLLGDTITGTWDLSKGTGTASMVISTADDFVERDRASYEKEWNDARLDEMYRTATLLGGNIAYQIECQVEVRYDAADRCYNISFSGTGSYVLKAEVVDSIEGANFDTWPSAQDAIRVTKTRTIETSDNLRLSFSRQITNE